MQLGITTIQRDREPWVKEWIAFHYLVGFRKFYFFAHNCSDNTADIVNELKKHFDIKLFTVGSDVDRPQLKCYQDAYDKFGHEVDWMAFIDSDEFLFPAKHDSMGEPLNEFANQKLSALGVYWSCFGSSGHIAEPPGLIIENYKCRSNFSFGSNFHIKSIVLGRQGSVKTINPHYFNTPFGTYDENLRPIAGGWTNYEPTYEKFRINHYVCQSRSYFLNFKCKVGTPDGCDKKNESDWEEYDRSEALDHSMERFIGPLKNILNSI